MSRLPYLLPYVRVLRLLHTILTTRRDEATWPNHSPDGPARPQVAVSDCKGRLVELSQAGRRLRAALAAALVPAHAPELALVHRWLDTWNGIGLVSAGIHRAGWDLQLIQYGTGHWRATFWVTGLAHSISGGSAYEREPWRAVQRAAWQALR
jgi:hypothetical protein